jgi:hypothetical protein
MRRHPLRGCRPTIAPYGLEIQRDLDAFLRYYNIERSHQGYRFKGRTPSQALRDALAIQDLPSIVPEQRVTPENEPDTLAV